MFELDNIKQIPTQFNFSYYSNFHKDSEAESNILQSLNV